MFNFDWFEQPFIFVSSKVPFAKLGCEEWSYKTVSKYAEAAVPRCSSEAIIKRCSVKKSVLRDFAKFTRKHLCQSLFINKVAGQGWQLHLKRDPGTDVSCEFCKISKNTFSDRTPFQTDHLWWLLLVLQNRCCYKFPDIHQKISVLTSFFNTVSGLKAHNFNEKETPTQMFSCEYHKIFKNSCFIEYLWWLLLNMVEEFTKEKDLHRHSIIDDMK